MRENRIQELAMIDDDLKVREAERHEHVGGRRQQLGLNRHRRRTDGVHIALEEFAKTPFLGTVSAPYGLHLVALEELRQLAAILGHDTGERHCQVVAERKVGLTGLGALTAL